jgi:hypothetical protein
MSVARAAAVAGLTLVVGCSWFSGDDGAAADAGVGLPCESAETCPADLVCAGGHCEAAGSVGLGGACWASRDCEADLFCTPQGVCGPAGTGDVGDSCGTGAECLPGLYCELFGFAGTCQQPGITDVGGACSLSADCIAGLVCGNDDTCQPPAVAYPPFTGVDCAADEDGFRMFFEVPRPGAPPADFYRLPFPSDARVSATGALDISDFPRPGKGVLGVDLVDLYANALTEDFAGFSTVAPIQFRFSSELDFDTADSGDVVHLVDITAGEQPSERQRNWSYASARGLYQCQNVLTLAVPNSQPLAAGHTYAGYLTTAVRGIGGKVPTQDPDLVAVLASTRPTGDEALGRAWDAHAPFRAYLGSEAIAPDTIAGVAVFTVQDPVARAQAVATAVAAEPAPTLSDVTLCDGTATSPCEDATGRGACVTDSSGAFYEIHGRISIPIFQQGTEPYEQPSDGGGIAVTGGDAVKVRDEDVCFALTVPKTTMPPGGWPVVAFGHGTGGGFTNGIDSGVAGALAGAATPMASFGYEGVVHGARRGGSSYSPDQLMFNILNPRAARDNNLQGSADVLQVLRLSEVANLDVTGVGAIAFDAARTYFFGHSQGSNVGVPAIALSTAPAAIFSGAGAHLTRAVLAKTSPVDAKAGLEFVLGEALTINHPVMVLWQTFFDPVDTLNYGALLVSAPPAGLASKHVFMSWGQGDTFSPEPTLNAMARVTGLPVAGTPIVDLDTGTAARPISANVVAGDGENRTAACFQYQPGSYDGHFVALLNPAAVSDWMAFLVSLADTGTPTVP